MLNRLLAVLLDWFGGRYGASEARRTRLTRRIEPTFAPRRSERAATGRIEPTVEFRPRRRA